MSKKTGGRVHTPPVTETPRVTEKKDKVSEALSMLQRANDLKQEAIEALLLERDEINEKLKTLGYVELVSHAPENNPQGHRRTHSPETRLRQRVQWAIRKGDTEESLREEMAKPGSTITEEYIQMFRQLKNEGSTGRKSQGTGRPPGRPRNQPAEAPTQ